MPVVGQSTGEPALLPFGRSRRSARRSRPPRRHRSVARSPSPESGPGLPVARLRCPSAPHRLPDDGAAPTPSAGCPTSVAGVGTPVCRSPGPVGPLDAVHAVPVARSIALAPSDRPPPGAVGVPRASADRMMAPPPVAPGCPSTRYDDAWWLSLRPEPLRLVDVHRFPSEPARRPTREDSVPVPVCVRSPVRRRLSRLQKTRSRGISESPDLSPELFVHPQEIVVRPPSVHMFVPRNRSDGGRRDRRDRRSAGRSVFDGGSPCRLNGGDALRRRDHRHSVEHVDTHVLVSPPTGRLFCCPTIGLR